MPVVKPLVTPLVTPVFRRQGKANFGDAGVFVEKYVQRARHIEVQIFGDGKGNMVTFVERECSIQRRHQKIVEETPSPYVGGLQTPFLADPAQPTSGVIGQSVISNAAGYRCCSAGAISNAPQMVFPDPCVRLRVHSAPLPRCSLLVHPHALQLYVMLLSCLQRV